jgi:hypothetical protein
MSLDVQLLDLAFVAVPLFPARPGAPTGPLDHEAIRRLRPAAEAAVELQVPQVARLGAYSVTLSPVRMAGALVGVMIVSHLEATDAAGQRHFATVSGWLRAAVEQHLASQAAGADHLGALNQALRAAALDGSDRQLVAVFAEALAVWHDIEVVGYVETAPGVFTRAVSLAGREQDVPPLVFPPQAVPAAQQLTRMPQTHVDAADRSGAADALVVTLTRSAGAIWLLTFSGEIDGCDPALLSSYVSALDITLALTTRAASARVALAVASDLAARAHDPQHALERALNRVRHALGAGDVRLSVKRADGTVAFKAQSRGNAPSTPAPASRLTIERRTPVIDRFAFEIERQDPGPWTPIEHAQARSVADVVEAWIECREPAAPSGTAPAPPPFEESLDAHVARTLARGEAVTLAVFSCAPPPTRQQAEALLAEARRVLREGDDAGRLADGRLAFLLTQTTAAQAPAVARRLRTQLAHAATPAGIAIVTESFATRMPGHEAGGSLLLEIRPTGHA